MLPLFSRRPGVTLVELLLFLAFFAIVGGTIVSILFATSEQRSRQQTIAAVERTGLQALQGLKWRLEHAERIIDPARGATGSLLAMQMGADSDYPLIVALESGSLVLVLRETKKVLTPEGMTASDLLVQNVSPSDARPSLLLSFSLAAPYPIPSSAVAAYSQQFHMAVTLLPEDLPVGNSCGCAAPSCVGGTYQWHVCTDDTCAPAALTLPCP